MAEPRMDKLSLRLFKDILSARYDLVSLARRHKLAPVELSDWIAAAKNRRVLERLCLMADVQAQLLLSRYRMLAATRLIKLATEETGDEPKGKGSGDTARRACVDLLKMELRRVALSDQVEQDSHDAAVPQTLRDALYGAGKDEQEEVAK